jgi:predicted transcriptional regulator
MSIRFQKERAAIARMLVSLFRLWAVYYPNMQLVDIIEFGFVHLFVFLGDVDNKPMTVSRLARDCGMSRATVLRRLQALVEFGSVKRAGRFYYLGENSVDPPNVEHIVTRTSRIIMLTAKELANLDSKMLPPRSQEGNTRRPQNNKETSV